MKTCLCEVFGFCFVWPGLVWPRPASPAPARPSPAQPRPAQPRPAQTQLGAAQPCNVSGLARNLVHSFNENLENGSLTKPRPFW